MSAALVESERISWLKAVTDFDETYKKFFKNYNGLLAQRNYILTQHPELALDYEDLVDRANETADKLATINNTVNKVKVWLSGSWSRIKSVFGFDGLGAIFLVAIPIAAVVAAIAAAGYVINDMYQFGKRIEMYKDAEAKGATPQQAAAVVDRTLGPPGSGIFGTGGIMGNIKWLIVGGIALLILPPIIRSFRQ